MTKKSIKQTTDAVVIQNVIESTTDTAINKVINELKNSDFKKYKSAFY